MDKKSLVYLVRHGQTQWSSLGKHTGHTDIPLTAEGERLAATLKAPLAKVPFSTILSSPLKRAVRTAEIAGFRPTLEPDLIEWNYGAYEGVTTAEIRAKDPTWNLFKDGCPGGEQARDVGARADRLIAKLQGLEGNALLFAHGHILRVFAARWLQLPPEVGTRFLLATESISILGFEHSSQEPVIRLWNSTT